MEKFGGESQLYIYCVKRIWWKAVL